MFRKINKSKFFSGAVSKFGMLASVLPVGLSAHHVHAQTTLPIIIVPVEELNFGTMTAGAGGSVEITTAGTRNPTGVFPFSGGLETNGSFSISGSTGVIINLSITSPTFTVSNGGGDTMNVDTFNIVTAAGGRTEPITLTSSTETFPVGATLRVSSGQAEGVYIGQYTLMATYM